jgi:hypothetical protein
MNPRLLELTAAARMTVTTTISITPITGDAAFSLLKIVFSVFMVTPPFQS